MVERDYTILRGPLTPGIKLEENVYVTMRDGVKIAVDIYRPEAEGSYPSLFSMSPYIKEIQQWPPVLSHSIEAGATSFFVPRGYVHVIAQIRGTGLSQGQWNLFDIKEQQDSYDLIEWIARQPWCNGNVGMIGDSYFAITQYLAAAQQPPHLKCIAPYDSSTDFYRDYCYKGGLYNGWWFGMWVLDTIRQCLWPGPVDGKLPPVNLLMDMMNNDQDGPYWWERSAWTKIDKIKVPVLSISPQPSDNHSRGQLWAFPRIKAAKKLVITPFCNSAFGNVLFMSQALNELLLKWYDYWLKGIDTGIMNEPEVSICDAATQEWRYENEYPLASTEWTKFYFRSNPAGSATKPPYGLLSREMPLQGEQPDSYITPESMISLSPASFGKPVLAYATPSLHNDIKVWGPISITIYASSTTLDTMWFVKLGDVDPDGKVTLLSNGFLKASYREVDEAMSMPGQPFHPYRNPHPPEPNKVNEYQIELYPRFYTFKKGHKIWLQIASEDYAYHFPLHTIYTTEMLPVPATNTIYHDSAHPSHLLLPVITDNPAIKKVGPPISRIQWPPLEMSY